MSDRSTESGGLRRFTPAFVFGALFLLGGIVLPQLGGPPALSDLQLVEGEVALVGHTPRSRYAEGRTVVSLAGPDGELPPFEAGPCQAHTAAIEEGDALRVWIEPTPAHDSLPRTWQIERNGSLLCDHADVVRSAELAGANAGVMGATFAFFGVALLALPFVALRLGRGNDAVNR